MIIMKWYITKGYKDSPRHAAHMPSALPFDMLPDVLLPYRIHCVSHSLSAGRRLS